VLTSGGLLIIVLLLSCNIDKNLQPRVLLLSGPLFRNTYSGVMDLMNMLTFWW